MWLLYDFIFEKLCIKVISEVLVVILKVTDENTRIRTNMSRIRNTALMLNVKTDWRLLASVADP